ncbi:ABC transporter permease [Allorhizocola rhizosphaerae]|uniref:ABC transporter permease n=1 Tax=Allorhizocola rhizosphaerae TaxID=1872709 RepID=UPI000E3BB594|nr:ABC transporter permease [Allorhizocola rhizosphaerae]
MTLTLVWRSLRHLTRSFDNLLMTVFLPLMILLLFVYVFGGAINTGTAYINYVVPGIVLLCAGYGASQTAVSVTNDMVRGIIDRFRSLPIAGSAVLTGHVAASVARILVSTAIVVGVALGIGFRPSATAAEWFGVLGMLVLFVLAMSWLSVVFGLIARTVEGAGGFSFFVLFLPYVSSAFVPTHTMPAALQFAARNQPMTPIIETTRGLLLGTPIGNSGWLAVAWCVGILVVSYALARYLFERRSSH